MNYSKDIQRRRRWFRFNYTLIVAAVFMTILGLVLGDWHPIPAAKYDSHSLAYLDVRQKILANPNLLINSTWVRGGSPEAVVNLQDAVTIDGVRTYRLTASLDAAPNLSAHLATNPIAVSGATTYVYEDDYLATVENQMEVEEFNAKNESIGRQFLSRYPSATASGHYSTHFITSPQATNVVIKRYIDQTGRLTLENIRLRTSPVAGFPQGMVSIVFDDNIAGAYTAASELKQYGFSATYYVVADTIGTNGYMTKEQLLSLKSASHEIASQTVTHRDLLGLSVTEQDKEISQSREKLSAMGFGEVRNFAAPFGKHDAQTKSLVRRYYRSQRNLEDQAINYPYNYDPFAIKAFVVDRKTDPARVASLIDQAKKTGGWLVLVYHDIGEQDDWEYRITPEAYAANLKAIQTSGITVSTMDTALLSVDQFFTSVTEQQP
jgi:peptidoglycan/xylan/chitin deacetylase (PgdA/CDA1 family)